MVIRRGAPLPAGIVGGWRKKRAARTVSDEISGAVVREGFYTRSQMPLIDSPRCHSKLGTSRPDLTFVSSVLPVLMPRSWNKTRRGR